MPLPFDATLKDLVRERPADWRAQFDAPGRGPVRVLTPDLSTLTAFADVVLHCGDSLLHLDFQSGPDPALPRRMLLYNALLHREYDLPVHSLVVLLRPRADRGDLTGAVRYEARPGRGGLDFRFEVVRLWQRPAEEFLTGALATMPLAVLGRLPSGPATALPGVVERMLERLNREVGRPLATKLVTAAYLLTGLRLSKERAREVFRRVKPMRESTTYMAILEEGEVSGIRRVLLHLGRDQFGDPDPSIQAEIQAIANPKRLERMCVRLRRINSWQELLATR